MRYREQVREEIAKLQIEISNSKTKNVELENRLLKLKLAEMEEDISEEQDKQILLKG